MFEINDEDVKAGGQSRALAKAIGDQISNSLSGYEKRVSSLEGIIPVVNKMDDFLNNVNAATAEEQARKSAVEKQERLEKTVSETVEKIFGEKFDTALNAAVEKMFDGAGKKATGKEGGDVRAAGESDTELDGNAVSVKKAEDSDSDDDEEETTESKKTMDKGGLSPDVIAKAVTDALTALGVTAQPEGTAVIKATDSDSDDEDEGETKKVMKGKEVGGNAVDPLTAAGAGEPVTKSVDGLGEIRLDQLTSMAMARKYNVATKAS